MNPTESETDPIDWSKTTYEGAELEAMRRWAALPLEAIITSLEEMQAISEALNPPPPANKPD